MYRNTSQKYCDTGVDVTLLINAVGVNGVGGNFPCFFSCFLRFFCIFPRFSLIPLDDQRKNDCNLLREWGMSFRPRLHRPRVELPDFSKSQNENRNPGTVSQEPKPELEPYISLESALQCRKPPFSRGTEPSELKIRTARMVACANRSRTDPWPPC